MSLRQSIHQSQPQSRRVCSVRYATHLYYFRFLSELGDPAVNSYCMVINGVPIADQYAEAFEMFACRAIVTAAKPAWALAAGQSVSGFATSIIRCDVEAAIERTLGGRETPDGRPGVSVLFFARTAEGLAQAVTRRVGQCVLTCATTACFNGLPNSPVVFGGGAALSLFGDGHQQRVEAHGRSCWSIPVMDGDFICEDEFSIVRGVAGGNFIIMGIDQGITLAAAEAAAHAARAVPDVILPFPLGIVRSGSKVGSQYSGLGASTNHQFCPTLRAIINDSMLPDQSECAYEIVIDGLTRDAVANAMRAGIHAACLPGVREITAGNYGGKLGELRLPLREILREN